MPANESLFMTNPAARTVRRVAGEAVEREAVEQGPAAPGVAVVTQAGSLAAAYVIHAIGVGHDRVADPVRLASAIRSLLQQYGPGMGYLATIRADGGPRVHPVSPVITDDGL